MKTKALIGAVIASAFLLDGEVQAGAGEAGTAGGSSKNSYGPTDTNVGGGYTYVPDPNWDPGDSFMKEVETPKSFTPNPVKKGKKNKAKKKNKNNNSGLNSNGQNPNGPGMQGSSQTGQDTGK